MPRYVAFLRSINVGKRRVSMSRLAEVFSHLGFQDVKTYIASGNVLFTAPKAGPALLEKRLSAALENALGFDVEVFIRSKEQVLEILARTPFDGIQESDTIHVVFLHKPLAKVQADGLKAFDGPHDAFQVTGCEYYWLCRIRVSESKVFSTPEVKRLILPSGTARNLDSLRKLASLHLQREL